MIRKELVAMDDTLSAEKAVRFPTGLAKQLDASVTMLGVIDLLSLIVGGRTPR